MALDLEEQEQVAELKAWWKQHGSLITAVVVAVAVALRRLAGLALVPGEPGGAGRGALYETLAKAAQANDAKALRDAARRAGRELPAHALRVDGRAGRRALLLRPQRPEERPRRSCMGDRARAVARTSSDLARLRLAAVLLDEKAYDEALKLLEAKHARRLRGAVRRAARRRAGREEPGRGRAERPTSSRSKRPTAQDSAFRESVRMRLDALGG